MAGGEKTFSVGIIIIMIKPSDSVRNMVAKSNFLWAVLPFVAVFVTQLLLLPILTLFGGAVAVLDAGQPLFGD